MIMARPKLIESLPQPQPEDNPNVRALVDMGATVAEALEILEAIRDCNKKLDSLNDKASAHSVGLATTKARLDAYELRLSRVELKNDEQAKTLTSLQVRLAGVAVAAGAASGAVGQIVAGLF